MFKLRVGYPTRKEEREILDRMTGSVFPQTKSIFSTAGIVAMRDRVNQVFMDERIKEYIIRLVMATRPKEILSNEEANADRVNEVRRTLVIGASPRATLFLTKASRAHALLEKRHFVIPDDVKAVAAEVLRHRLIPNFRSRSEKSDV